MTKAAGYDTLIKVPDRNGIYKLYVVTARKISRVECIVERRIVITD